MLHFFRKIRRELLANNKTIRYLKYGVGEIILVVIGILIAIQVDNWNDDRIAAENNKLLFQEVNDELVQNIKEVDKVMNTYLSEDSLYFKVLNKKVDYEDYKNDLGLFWFTQSWKRTNLVDGDFQELLAGKENLTELQDSILSKLRDLYGRRKLNADKDEDEIADIRLHQEMKWMDELPWLFDRIGNYTIPEEMIQYALTDPFYHNNVFTLQYRERGHLFGMLWFRILALDIYKEISDMLETEKETSLVRDIKDFEHVNGVYGLYWAFADWRLEIRGQEEFKAIFYENDSLYSEWDIHPYSNSYLIFRSNEDNQNRIYRIVLGNDGELLGLINVGYHDMDENGNRLMWKKIE